MSGTGLRIIPGVLAAIQSPFDRARRLQEEGRYAEAESLYRSVLKAQPDSIPALTNLGVVLARQGKHAEAVTSYQRALKLDPSLTGLRLNVGIAYFRSEDWKNAVIWLEQTLKSDPGNRQALQLLATAYVQVERFDDAIRTYERLMPADNAAVLLGAATAYVKSGRHQEGEALLKSCLPCRKGPPSFT